MVNFKLKLVRRGKESHYIPDRGTIQQKKGKLINVYAENTGAPAFMKQTAEIKR